MTASDWRTGSAFPRTRALFTSPIQQSGSFTHTTTIPSTVQRKRPFVRVGSNEGLPDGLTVDAEGFVWSAQWFGGCIVRYDPDGKVERRIPVPAKQSSSLAFGGRELTSVFVTSASFSDALPLAPPDYDAQQGYLGGKLFLAELGIVGKPEFRCRIHPKIIS